jgi:hypothetical protein
MIFLFFPLSRKYNHPNIPEAVNQGKIREMANTLGVLAGNWRHTKTQE